LISNIRWEKAKDRVSAFGIPLERNIILVFILLEEGVEETQAEQQISVIDG